MQETYLHLNVKFKFWIPVHFSSLSSMKMSELTESVDCPHYRMWQRKHLSSDDCENFTDQFRVFLRELNICIVNTSPILPSQQAGGAHFQ